MVRSMTAYARHETNTLSWEIRSTNHRYLDIVLDLPKEIRSIELLLREKIRSYLSRGRIECSLTFNKPSRAKKLYIDKKLVTEIIKNTNSFLSKGNIGKINPLDILKWPGVTTNKVRNLEDIHHDALSAFKEALEKLSSSRKREGEELEKCLKKYLKSINLEINSINLRIPEILKYQRQRLIEKFNTSQLKIEKTRLEQELLLTMTRFDIAEELERLRIHVKEIFNILKEEEPMGRRLDFMMQEINRESNSLSSKSSDIPTTASSIEVKVLVEKIREQIQNIE